MYHEFILLLCLWAKRAYSLLRTSQTIFSIIPQVPSYKLSPSIGLGIPFRLHLTRTRTLLSSTSRFSASRVGLIVSGLNFRTRTNTKRCSSISLGRMAQHLSRTHLTRTLLQSERVQVSLIPLLCLITPAYYSSLTHCQHNIKLYQELSPAPVSSSSMFVGW